MENEPINSKDYRRPETTLEELKERLNNFKSWRESAIKDFEEKQKGFYEEQKLQSERIEDLERTIFKLEAGENSESPINSASYRGHVSDINNNPIDNVVSKAAIDQINELIERLEYANKLSVELFINMNR